MARVNVYLPDELADEVRKAGLSVSTLTQEAVRAALDRRRLDRWLDELDAVPLAAVTPEDVLDAVREAREELGGPRAG